MRTGRILQPTRQAIGQTADLTDEQRHAIAHRNAENVMGI
jgi:hypothetical protein